MSRCEDVKMWRCEHEKMWRWADVKMWRWADVKMRRCEDEKMWGWDVSMRRCEDEQMWGCEDEQMWRCEDEQMWGWEDAKMRRCEDEKMWRWEDVLQTPTIERTLRSDALGKKHPKCDDCQHNIGIWPTTPEEIYCVGQPLRIKNEWMCSRLWKGLTSIRPRTHLEYGNRRTIHRIVYCHILYSNCRCFRAISYIYFFAYTSIREVERI